MPSYFNQVQNPSMQVTASLRETITDIRNAFLSCSFTRTLQSGSIDDLNTLTPLTTPHTQYTYDIFAFTDALQSTSPVFIKVRYLSGHGTTAIQIGCQMGTAHDNSGSLAGAERLTEITSTSVQSLGSIVGSSITACGDGSYMTLAVFPQMAHGQFFVFERLYDTLGQPTGSGFHMLGTDGQTSGKTIYSQVGLVGKAPSTRESSWIPNSRPSRVPATYNGRLVLGLIYPFFGKPYNPSPNILLGTSTDFPNILQSINYTTYGTEKSYIAMGSNFNQTNSQIYTNGRFLLRNS